MYETRVVRVGADCDLPMLEQTRMVRYKSRSTFFFFGFSLAKCFRMAFDARAHAGCVEQDVSVFMQLVLMLSVS